MIIGLSGTGKTTTTFTTQNGRGRSRTISWVLGGGSRLRNGERVLREDLLARSGVRAIDIRRGHQADHVSGERLPGRLGERELLRAELHAERAGGLRDAGPARVRGRTQRGARRLPADPQPQREHHPRRSRSSTQEQAAAYFMLGETTGTSAGGASEEGKFLRVPGTNPFFPLPHGLQGNRLLELLATHPDRDVPAEHRPCRRQGRTTTVRRRSRSLTRRRA